MGMTSPAANEPRATNDPRPPKASPHQPRQRPLTDDELAILEFERKWWKQAGAKESAVREQFGLSATRYYQVLNRLLDLPAALETDPSLVGRLRRMREERSR